MNRVNKEKKQKTTTQYKGKPINRYMQSRQNTVIVQRLPTKIEWRYKEVQ